MTRGWGTSRLEITVDLHGNPEPPLFNNRGSDVPATPELPLNGTTDEVVGYFPMVRWTVERLIGKVKKIGAFDDECFEILIDAAQIPPGDFARFDQPFTKKEIKTITLAALGDLLDLVDEYAYLETLVGPYMLEPATICEFGDLADPLLREIAGVNQEAADRALDILENGPSF